MTRISLISLALLTAFTQLAAAEDNLYQSNVRNSMRSFLNLREDVLKKTGIISGNENAEKCRSIVAQARDLKMTEAAEWSLVCDDWARAELAEPALQAAFKTYDWLDRIRLDAGHFNETSVPIIEESAKNCIDVVDRALAGGAPPKLVSDFGRPIGEVALDELKAKICQPAADMVTKYGKDPGAMERTRLEAKAAPYKAVGIKGDRLALLLDHGGYAMYGVGGGELMTIKQLKAAKLIFEVLQGNDGWTVRRYLFKGDKLVSTTSQGYLLKPGARAFR